MVHTAQRRYHLLYGITRADADDPLKKVALTESVQDRQAAMAKAVEEEDAGTRYGRPLSRAIPMRGMALAEHIGVAALLLAVAWLLLTQLFRRRALALVVVAVAMVLYVAALDRWALGTHLSHLADTSAPLRHRLTACDQATDTFFYCPTAIEGLRSVADDPAASPFLRDRARRTAEELENGMTGNMRM